MTFDFDKLYDQPIQPSSFCDASKKGTLSINQSLNQSFKQWMNEFTFTFYVTVCHNDQKCLKWLKILKPFCLKKKEKSLFP